MTDQCIRTVAIVWLYCFFCIMKNRSSHLLSWEAFTPPVYWIYLKENFSCMYFKHVQALTWLKQKLLIDQNECSFQPAVWSQAFVWYIWAWSQWTRWPEGSSLRALIELLCADFTLSSITHRVKGLYRHYTRMTVPAVTIFRHRPSWLCVGSRPQRCTHSLWCSGVERERKDSV